MSSWCDQTDVTWSCPSVCWSSSGSSVRDLHHPRSRNAALCSLLLLSCFLLFVHDCVGGDPRNSIVLFVFLGMLVFNFVVGAALRSQGQNALLSTCWGTTSGEEAGISGYKVYTKVRLWHQLKQK